MCVWLGGQGGHTRKGSPTQQTEPQSWPRYRGWDSGPIPSILISRALIAALGHTSTLSLLSPLFSTIQLPEG